MAGGSYLRTREPPTWGNRPEGLLAHLDSERLGKGCLIPGAVSGLC